MVKSVHRRIALAGDVALELLEPYFRQAGWDVYVPAGFGTWRQEMLDPGSALHAFKPDLVFDVTAKDAVLEKEVPGFFDARMAKLASMPYSLSGIMAIVEEAEFAFLAAPKKVLALDADGTLWRGVLSEDGLDGIEVFSSFQSEIKKLSDEGTVLALLTKNDPWNFSAGMSPFSKRAMPLGLEDFAAVRAGWNPKRENLEDTAKALGLGTDSFVFVDDNPAERAGMSAAHPEVAVLAPPGPSSAEVRQFMRRLREYFFSSGISGLEEDRLRALDYKSRAHRPDPGAASMEEYLESLGLEAVFRQAVPADIPRLAQMAARTNQFNSTGIRRSKEDFVALLADVSKRVFVCRASDKFVDQGIVAYAVCDLPSRRLTDFAMSCRAMGRTLEYFIWRKLRAVLGFEPVVDFVPSPRNAPFAAFLAGDKSRATYYADRSGEIPES